MIVDEPAERQRDQWRVRRTLQHHGATRCQRRRKLGEVQLRRVVVRGDRSDDAIRFALDPPPVLTAVRLDGAEVGGQLVSLGEIGVVVEDPDRTLERRTARHSHRHADFGNRECTEVFEVLSHRSRELTKARRTELGISRPGRLVEGTAGRRDRPLGVGHRRIRRRAQDRLGCRVDRVEAGAALGGDELPVDEQIRLVPRCHEQSPHWRYLRSRYHTITFPLAQHRATEGDRRQMDIELTDDQVALRDAVRDVVGKECSPAFVRAVIDEGADPTPWWETMVGLDWPGLAVPEEFGGGSRLDRADDRARGARPRQRPLPVPGHDGDVRAGDPPRWDAAQRAEWLGRVAGSGLVGALALGAAPRHPDACRHVPTERGGGSTDRSPTSSTATARRHRCRCGRAGGTCRVRRRWRDTRCRPTPTKSFDFAVHTADLTLESVAVGPDVASPAATALLVRSRWRRSPGRQRQSARASASSR